MIREPTETMWSLGQVRTAHVVLRSDGTGYTVRVRWSRALGLQLDYVFVTARAARSVADRINRARVIRPTLWKKIYHPSWSPQCETIKKPARVSSSELLRGSGSRCTQGLLPLVPST